MNISIAPLVAVALAMTSATAIVTLNHESAETHRVGPAQVLTAGDETTSSEDTHTYRFDFTDVSPSDGADMINEIALLDAAGATVFLR